MNYIRVNQTFLKPPMNVLSNTTGVPVKLIPKVNREYILEHKMKIKDIENLRADYKDKDARVVEACDLLIRIITNI